MKCVLNVIGIAILALPLWAGEYVNLSNGSRLHADRHEIEGNVVRIYTQGGITEMSVSLIAGYEQEEAPAPSPATSDSNASPASSPVRSDTPLDLAAYAAKTSFLPESFVESVMRAESGFNPNAVSPKGAIGLMQLMPQTAKQLGVDVNDPAGNAQGGAEYLRELLAKYENDPDQVLLALAAYNAGPAAVERYGGVPPYRETREYILRVLKNWREAGSK